MHDKDINSVRLQIFSFVWMFGPVHCLFITVSSRFSLLVFIVMVVVHLYILQINIRTSIARSFATILCIRDLYISVSPSCELRSFIFQVGKTATHSFSFHMYSLLTINKLMLIVWYMFVTCYDSVFVHRRIASKIVCTWHLFYDTILWCSSSGLSAPVFGLSQNVVYSLWSTATPSLL